MQEAAEWLRSRRIEEVECVVPDITGMPRGKVLPVAKFLKALKDDSLRLPEGVFLYPVSGDWLESRMLDPREPDCVLIPDLSTLRVVPWYNEPTAQVICDAVDRDGEPIVYAPRDVLRRVLRHYADQGWKTVVAPELEFYFVARNTDSDYPLQPPVGRSGRTEAGRQPYSIDAVNEFDPIFDDIYDYCEQQGIEIDTIIHEEGLAQVEVNIDHDDPILVADQAFLFKRTVREAALKHGLYATFMAKPHANEPGSALHLHQSVHDAETGRNLFANDDGSDSELLLHHIAGMQKFLPAVMPLVAPNVNSYRRITPEMGSPINTHWGHDNRTTGFRVPRSGRESRRVENRVPGADANAYLAIAGSLACGYLGMVEKLMPTEPLTGNAYERKFALPRFLSDALQRLRNAHLLKEILHEDFVTALIDVKETEMEAFHQVISPWEREHLLLHV
ncbi:MAG: glutamine synthetase family protein [Pseudomonadota bacterium]|nr:glutamine synthetase family protein [Pseudomonadota bacterium]